MTTQMSHLRADKQWENGAAAAKKVEVANVCKHATAPVHRKNSIVVGQKTVLAGERELQKFPEIKR